ncbi:MAG: Holliday junction branch migration protein RuvA [Bacteroidales bacterium]|nr:Holliday junction branch migration protein RuvA [Bacteroidales bacterium]
MIDYIKGKIIELSPAELILECGGIGYSILISLQTYEALQMKTDTVIYIHHYLREEEELFFGFATKDERELFRLLISVSGIGVASARMMLSSLSSEEIRNAIIAEDIHKIKSVKGIGLKSAQRLILELKDKVLKGGGSEAAQLFPAGGNAALVDEATTALVMLGFSKANIAKVMPSILKENPGAKVEEIIKSALKKL